MRRLIIWCAAVWIAALTLTTPYPLLALAPLLLVAHIRLILEPRYVVTDNDLWDWIDG